MQHCWAPYSKPRFAAFYRRISVTGDASSIRSCRKGGCPAWPTRADDLSHGHNRLASHRPERRSPRRTRPGKPTPLGSRPRRPRWKAPKPAAGDGDGAASMRPVSTSPEGAVREAFPVGNRVRATPASASASPEALDTNVENLQGRGAEAGIEHEIEVRTCRGAPAAPDCRLRRAPSQARPSSASCPRRTFFR